MLPIHTILHPTDFTEHSAASFYLACDLAREYQARLVMIHVSTEPLHFLFETGLPTAVNCKDALRENLESIGVSDVHVTRRVEEGEPAEEILRAAKLCDADLIVMGTHGRRGLTRMIMGSVAERIIREAPCPVLTVRSRESGVRSQKSAIDSCRVIPDPLAPSP
jgi:nucleotide-binding universal stress UspA family protein